MTTSSGDPPVPRSVGAKIVEVFGADLRSLAAFRIVLAVLVLADLANRASDLTAHYADRGVMPRTALLQEVLNRWSFSLNVMNGEPFFQALLFGVAALAALGLLVGYHTRLMTAVAWVLLLSIQMRNPLVSGSDAPLLHLLLFWGMFLPLGAYWSVDRSLEATPRRLSTRFLSFASAGLFLQIAFMYWFTALLKSGPEWRTDSTAIYYALNIDQVARPLGTYLLNFPTLLELMTVATIVLEAFGPFLLFFPFFTGPVRTAAVAAFMGLHFGIWTMMDIGIFPFISAFCMVCFLPGWFWDGLVPRIRRALPEQPAVRGVQRATARLTRAYWPPLRSRLSPTAGIVASGAGSAPGGHDRTVSSDADARASRASAGDAGQDKDRASAKAEGRRAARDDSAAGPGLTMLRSSRATNLLALFFLLYVFCWNLTTVSSFALPERVAAIGPLLGLDQYWGMFAPTPPKNDGWFVIPGNLRGGQQVDLMSVIHEDFNPRQVSWEKPKYVASTDNNEHWRKYLENIGQEKFANQRVHFGRYICREWNARHAGGEQLKTFQITYMLETTLPDYKRSEPKKLVLWEHSCF